MAAAIPVPPRLLEDFQNGESRNLRLFLQNVKERLDQQQQEIERLRIQVNVLMNQ